MRRRMGLVMTKHELVEKWVRQATECLTEPTLCGDSHVMLKVRYEDLGEIEMAMMGKAMADGTPQRMVEYYVDLARKCCVVEAEVAAVMDGD